MYLISTSGTSFLCCDKTEEFCVPAIPSLVSTKDSYLKQYHNEHCNRYFCKKNKQKNNIILKCLKKFWSILLFYISLQPGQLVLWPAGALASWWSGQLVLWPAGVLASWCSGQLAPTRDRLLTPPLANCALPLLCLNKFFNICLIKFV